MIASIFLSGVTMATFSAAGIFFFKFWRASGDRFYLLFFVACELIAIERIVALTLEGTREAISSTTTDAVSWIYLIRLLAFVAITVGIIETNRPIRPL